mmetsp:Transcript_4461/g.10352  ORF Transcript_4461/g.10352 Transcript_4461/m.10352 type:complete len:176 (+) Transcript_4461:96-623(+)
MGARCCDCTSAKNEPTLKTIVAEPLSLRKKFRASSSSTPSQDTRDARKDVDGSELGNHDAADSSSSLGPDFSRFAGLWLRQVDGMYMCVIRGDGYIGWNPVFEEAATPLQLGDEGELSVAIYGQVHTGVLDDEGHLLRWSDGETWAKKLSNGIGVCHCRRPAACALLRNTEHREL